MKSVLLALNRMETISPLVIDTFGIVKVAVVFVARRPLLTSDPEAVPFTKA